jgi:hypothetical protein
MPGGHRAHDGCATTWATISTVNVDEITDRLYALPPEEFTRARNQAEGELRKAGKRELADQVKALRKPTAAASTVNQLVRNHRAEVEAFLEAAARLRDAQVAGKGDLAEATQAERVARNELVALGGEQVRATLQAAAVDDGIARDLLAARLVHEPEPAGFGTLLAHAGPASARAPRAKQSSARTARPDEDTANTRLHEAKKILGEVATEERQARRRWEQTQRELEKAQTAVEKAQRELDRLRGR